MRHVLHDLLDNCCGRCFVVVCWIRMTLRLIDQQENFFATATRTPSAAWKCTCNKMLCNDYVVIFTVQLRLVVVVVIHRYW